MTARKKAEPKGEPKAAPAETPTPEPTPTPSKPSTVGGLAELQAKADADTARGYTGPEKENSHD
jgi:hypothetical protein